MGIAYCCDKDIGITVTVWDGVVTPEEWRAHIRRQDADPDWPTGPAFLGQLTTARGLSAFDASVVDEMRALYRDRAKQLARIRSAVVSDRAFGASGQLEQAVAETSGVRNIMFNDVATACMWLGVDVSAVQTIIDRLRASLRTDAD
jgi:hypothetical protein